MTSTTLKKLASRRWGFLIFVLGGSGARACQIIRRNAAAEGFPFPMVIVYIDTEPGEHPAADITVPLLITPDDLEAIKADPKRFGPVAIRMTKEYPEFLEEDSSGSGSRTFRALTMLACEVHMDKIVNAWKTAVRTLKRTHGVDTVVPMLVGGTGGGAGSALVILQAMLLHNKRFRSLVTEGLNPHLITKPVAVVSEPYAYADCNLDAQAERILANAFAFRIESALIERECFQYIYHQGMSNDGGAMLDDIEQSAYVLGQSTYELCRYWGEFIKLRYVDNWDTFMATACYLADDLPENVRPPEDRPKHVPKPKPCEPEYAISMTNGSVHV